MRRCWDDNADLRPDFPEINKILREITLQHERLGSLEKVDDNKITDLAQHVIKARRRASIVGIHDFQCSHEAMNIIIPIASNNDGSMQFQR